MASFEFEGVSGRGYTYLLLGPPNLTMLPKQAGCVIFARDDNTPVYISCSHSVRAAVLESNSWPVAQNEHGATRVFARFDQAMDEESRNREKMDLIEAYHPPMNARPV